MATIICSPVEDPKHVRGRTAKCATCKRKIHVSADSERHVRAQGHTIRLVCVGCAGAEWDGSPILTAPIGSLVTAVMGVDPTDVFVRATVESALDRLTKEG